MLIGWIQKTHREDRARGTGLIGGQGWRGRLEERYRKGNRREPVGREVKMMKREDEKKQR